MDRICRVLVVENSKDIQDLLEHTFIGEGYRFAIAANPTEMRQILARGDVDVVIIDVILPGQESGLALAEEVAAQGYGVVLVTGHPAHFESVKRSGHRFLYKPFNLDSLVQLVDDALREARAKCKTKKNHLA